MAHRMTKNVEDLRGGVEEALEEVHRSTAAAPIRRNEEAGKRTKGVRNEFFHHRNKREEVLHKKEERGRVIRSDAGAKGGRVTRRAEALHTEEEGALSYSHRCQRQTIHCVAPW